GTLWVYYHTPSGSYLTRAYSPPDGSTSERLLHDRDGLDLDQPFRSDEAPHDDERARRRARGVHVPVTNFADGGNERGFDGVGAKVAQLDDVVRRAAGRAHRGVDVLEHLFELRAKVVFSDEVAVLVESDLAGDVNELAARHLGKLRVAGGRLEHRFG